MSVRFRLGLALLLAGLTLAAAPAVRAADELDKRELPALGIELGSPAGWHVRKGFRSCAFNRPKPWSQWSEADRAGLNAELASIKQLAADPQRQKTPASWPTPEGLLDWLGLESTEKLVEGLSKINPADADATPLYEASFVVRTVPLRAEDMPLAIQEIASPYIEAERRRRAHFKILEERDLVIGDLEAVRFTIQHQRKAWWSAKQLETYTEFRYYVCDNINLYTLTCTTSDPQAFSRYKPTFEKMAKSFKFLGLP